MAQMHNNLSPADGIWSLRRLPDMDEAQFSQWQTLLEHRTGITLSAERRSFLETNLGIRMREIGCNSYQAYYEKIVSGPDAIREWATLVDRLTVQETRFYRDPDAFRLVADYIMTRPREQLKKRALEAWSVGCSTGEEPYTLAMTLHDACGQNDTGISVLATDIDTQILTQAKKGVYTLDRIKPVPPEFLRRYFLRGTGRQSGMAMIKPVIRNMVTFEELNLVSPSWPVSQKFDAIFLSQYDDLL
jgi:chemotaxis protein methyltransferase CheR/type IV pilus assembly protein PilK